MATSSSSGRGQGGIGCKRLFDYYFVVTCSDHGKQQTVRRLKSKSLAGAHDKDPVHAQFALRPKIVDRYPNKPYPDCHLLPWVARASMPRGVRARTRPPPPKYFTFTGWNTDGHKLYGACLEVFEHIEIKNQKQPVYLPKTLGLLSHHPYFHAYEIFLKCLWHTIPKRIIPIEDLILHYFYDIPAPPVSKKLAYNLGSFKLYLGARNEFDIPIKELPIEVPFTQLSKDRMCTILKLLLLEKRVVFVCQFIPELTPVCELFSSLLFPLQWKHLFIPLVSKTVADALKDYQHPFLAGLPRFVFVRPEIHKNMPKDSFIVFLDRNEICDTNQQPISDDSVPELPLSLEDNLQNAIHRLARILTMPYVSREITLQALRDMFAVITKLIFVTANPQLFEIDSDGTNDFCAMFRKTELFTSFIKYYKRVNPKDSMAKDVYPFYKSNEALGKHFARRSHTISWSRGFDEKQYHEKDKFRVNKDVIERGATMKKRPEPWPNGKRFVYAPEFEWTGEAREFHESWVFVPETGDNKRRTRKKDVTRGRKKDKGGSGGGSGGLFRIDEQANSGQMATEGMPDDNEGGNNNNNNNTRGGNNDDDEEEGNTRGGNNNNNNNNSNNGKKMGKNENLNDEAKSEREKEFRQASLTFLEDMKNTPNLGDRVVIARQFEKWFKTDDDKKYFMNVLLEDEFAVNILMAMSRSLDEDERQKIRRTFKVTRYVDHKLRKIKKQQKLSAANGGNSNNNGGGSSSNGLLSHATSDTSLTLYSPRSEASDTNLLSDIDSGHDYSSPKNGNQSTKHGNNNKENSNNNQSNTKNKHKQSLTKPDSPTTSNNNDNRDNRKKMKKGSTDSSHSSQPSSPKDNSSKSNKAEKSSNNNTNNNNNSSNSNSKFGKYAKNAKDGNKAASPKHQSPQQKPTTPHKNGKTNGRIQNGKKIDIDNSPESLDSPHLLSDMSDDDDDDDNARRRRAKQNGKNNNNGNSKSGTSKNNDSSNNNGNGKKVLKKQQSNDSDATESESGSDGSDSSSGSGSSEESDSSVESDWATDTTITERNDNENSRRESVASVRQGEKFVHLNEFELREKEKRIMMDSQRRHNTLLGNVEPEVIVATDLFTKSVLQEWKQQQSHSTRAGTTKKKSKRNVTNGH